MFGWYVIFLRFFPIFFPEPHQLGCETGKNVLNRSRAGNLRPQIANFVIFGLFWGHFQFLKNPPIGDHLRF